MNNSPTSSKINLHTKRSLSMSSEASGLHVRLPTLHHSEREPAPYSPISQNNMCPSESNWANKYEDFDIGKPIGYGSSAVVYEAVYKPLKKRVAVKMIDLDMFERNQIDELRRETALMALSKHPNVLRVYGSFVNGSKLYIVTPYLSAGSCLDIMKTSFPDGLDEISIATILKQALEGLVYLHKNGHIHRDVKAGNLLMDQYGTVLLADFGVSSSLTENGDMRKTEATKHKYSKLFKDMIDLCLQKDPSKRPSAEKLLAHPFFKQAKKKDHLVKSILSHVLPLDQRPHKKVPQKHISFEATEQWDFDTQDNDPPVVIDKSETPILSSAPLERSRSVVQFEECPKPIHKSSSPVETEPIKKHISFGDAVIRELPSVNRPGIMSPLVESPPHHDDYLPTTTPKKSRFVIEGTQPSPASDSPASNVSAEAINVHSGGVGLGISTTPVNNTHALPPPPPPPLSSAAANIQSNDNTLQEGEFKKGRFS
ncbi:hypothetical protein CU098_001015, partial [Rhizopus stolonifer]